MTRPKMVAVGIAATLALTGYIAIAAVGDGPKTVISARTLHDDTYNIVDRAKAGEDFRIMRGPVAAADLTGIPATPPPGEGYPSITDEADRDGDFDAACQLFGGDGGWNNSAIGTDHPGTGTIDRTLFAEGNCSVHLTSGSATSGTRHRAELAFNPISNPDVIYEGLWYVPSTSGALGYMTQHKMSGNGGNCSNGGLNNDSGRDLAYAYKRTCSEGAIKVPLGIYPTDQWFAVRARFRLGQAGEGLIGADVDRDGPGPGGYVAELAPTVVDTNTASDSNTVRFRQGTYHDGAPVAINIDGYRLDCLAGC